MYMFDCLLSDVLVRACSGGWAVDGLGFIEDIYLSARHSRLAYDLVKHSIRIILEITVTKLGS